MLCYVMPFIVRYLFLLKLRELDANAHARFYAHAHARNVWGLQRTGNRLKVALTLNSLHFQSFLLVVLGHRPSLVGPLQP